jgi:autotransporter-associated beta strand protein
MAALSARPLFAQTVITWEQNANGQDVTLPDGYNYTYPSNSNWSQAEVDGTDPDSNPYAVQPSNWSTTYYPGAANDPNPAGDTVVIPSLATGTLAAPTVNLDVNVTIGTLNVNTGATLNILSGSSLNALSIPATVGVTNAGTININSTAGSLTADGYIQSGGLTLVGGTLNSSPIINGGTLQIGDGDSTGAVNGSMTDNMAVVIDRDDANAIVSSSISGSGSVTNAGPGTVTLTGNNTYDGTTIVKNGALVIGAATALPTGGPVFNTATLSIQSGTAAAPVVSGPISANGTLTVGAASTPGYLQLQAGNGSASVSSLNIAANSTLDVTNNVLTITFTAGNDPASTIRGYLASGYDNDTWKGPGIVSSNAAAKPGLYAVGYADGARDAGTPASSTQVLVENTLAGDANLDRTVNFADLLVVAQNFNHVLDTHGNSLDWADGDFNYDGQVNFADLLLVAQNFNKTLTAGQLTKVPGSFAAAWNLALADVSQSSSNNVPEPATTSLVAIAAAGLLRRRRGVGGASTGVLDPAESAIIFSNDASRRNSQARRSAVQALSNSTGQHKS